MCNAYATYEKLTLLTISFVHAQSRSTVSLNFTSFELFYFLLVFVMLANCIYYFFNDCFPFLSLAQQRS